MSDASRLRVAVIGCGFIGMCHIDAIRRIEQIELVAVADASASLRQSTAERLGVPGFCDVQSLLAAVDVDAVHNCTPNYLHQPINEQIIAAGKHILCEKPLATSSQEAELLLESLSMNKPLVHCVNFNYRMYPMVQWMHQQIEGGAAGGVLAVHGGYLQDHLLYDTDYSWKVERAYTGPSRCVADIGSHWMDLAQVVTGARITQVLADLATFHPVRQKRERGGLVPVAVSTEDYGSVLLRMDNGAHGSFTVSNASAGRKNDLHIEVDGTIHALRWAQETPNDLWVGSKGAPNQLLTRDPALLEGEALSANRLPAGHPEGWSDAIRRNIQCFYQFILDGKRVGEHHTPFATFVDGLNSIRLVEAILRSHTDGGWVRV